MTSQEKQRWRQAALSGDVQCVPMLVDNIPKWRQDLPLGTEVPAICVCVYICMTPDSTLHFFPDRIACTTNMNIVTKPLG